MIFTSGQYSSNNNIIYKTSMLRSDLCGYSDAYIVVKGTITVERDHDDRKRNKKMFHLDYTYQKFITHL